MPADTIFAPATARGRAGVAVIRISGPEAHGAVHALCGDVPPERVASLRQVSDGAEILDEALVLVFGAGRSFTGEAVAELQLHGSPAVLAAVLAALGRMGGLRPAEPGEFTRRALENGRLDLSQVEGLADLLAAETEIQRKQARRVLSGAIGQRAEIWRRDLIHGAALLEATLDFAEEDVPAEVRDAVSGLLAGVRADLAREVQGFASAERVRDGFEVAIVGPPNIGKSTLLNKLAGRDAALTSAVAGTTRDVIEVRMDIAGLAVTLLDTAGIRDAEDLVERLGVDRAVARAEEADLRIFLLPADSVPEPSLYCSGDIVVVGKGDLLGDVSGAVSGVTGLGVDRLVTDVAGQLSQLTASAGTLTHARHAAAARRAADALASALSQLGQGGPEEVVAEDIRAALRALDALVGRVDVEHILDKVFASFCIGK